MGYNKRSIICRKYSEKERRKNGKTFEEITMNFPKPTKYFETQI